MSPTIWSTSVALARIDPFSGLYKLAIKVTTRLQKSTRNSETISVSWARRPGRFLLEPLGVFLYLRQEKHHEVSAHFRWHQEYEHPQCAARPAGQTDCRVQRPLHSHRGVCQPRWCCPCISRDGRVAGLFASRRRTLPEALARTGTERVARAVKDLSSVLQTGVALPAGVLATWMSSIQLSRRAGGSRPGNKVDLAKHDESECSGRPRRRAQKVIT